MAPRPWVCGKVSPLLIARVGHLQLHVGLFPFTVYVKHGGQCQYKYELFYKCLYQYLDECVEPERTNSTISAAATRILLTQTKKSRGSATNIFIVHYACNFRDAGDAWTTDCVCMYKPSLTAQKGSLHSPLFALQSVREGRQRLSEVSGRQN